MYSLCIRQTKVHRPKLIVSYEQMLSWDYLRRRNQNSNPLQFIMATIIPISVFVCEYYMFLQCVNADVH